MQQKLKEIVLEIKKSIIGKDDIICKMMMAILAQGHILLEDIPGVGKTTLALSFSKAMSLQHKRLQFTSDVMPSDVTGFSIYNRETGTLDYKPGAALCNLFLADEINRASSKTQSALLEVMEEGNITVDGTTRPAPKPYVVIATQNPLGFAGTQTLPESQLDRFMVCLSMGYPGLEEEVEIMKSRREQDPLDFICPVASAQDICDLQRMAGNVYLSDAVYRYIARLSAATRENEWIRLGLSPRGSMALAKMTKAAAFLAGRDYALPKDVQLIFPDVARHRIVLSTHAKIGTVKLDSLLGEIVKSVPAPSLVKGKE